MKSRFSESINEVRRRLETVSPVLPNIFPKRLTEDLAGIMYLSGEEMNKIIKSDKKHEKSKTKKKDTRDISHLKDSLKKKTASVPLLLPTNINYLKALVESPSSIGVSLSHKSSPMVCKHKECLEMALIRTSTENFSSKSIHTLEPSETFTVGREALGSPSGLQDIESLNEWFNKMKKTCKNEEELEIIHNMCAKELVRQVKVHCTLRGKVLKKVLDSQPAIFSKKYNKLLEDFRKYKEEQISIIKKLKIDCELALSAKDQVITELQSSLKKSEEARIKLDEAVLNHRLQISDIKRQGVHAEQIWRKKAANYLAELNKAKKVLYVGTDKLAKFFAKQKSSNDLGIDSELMDLLFEFSQEPPLPSDPPKGFTDNELLMLTAIKELIVQESELSRSESFTHKESKDSFNKKENSTSSRKSSKVLSNIKRSDEDNLEFNEKILDESAVEMPKINFEFSKQNEDFLKPSEDCHHSRLSDQAEYNFSDDIDGEDRGGTAILVSLEASKAKINLVNSEINEAPSHLEESRDASVSNDKSIMYSKAVSVAEAFAQTDQKIFYNFESLEELLKACGNDESKATIISLQKILDAHYSYLFESTPLPLNSPDGSKKLTLTSDSSKILTSGTKKSFDSADDIKNSLIDIVKSAGNLVASYELRKQELIQLDEELEYKSNLLKIMTQEVTASDSYKNSKAANDPIRNLKKKATLPVGGLEISNSWMEGYETGIEDGKIQGYLSVVEKLKSPKESNEPETFVRQETDYTPALKKKATRSGTRFSEFNFHVPSKTMDKKKNHPGPQILEKFLRLPLGKIKLKSAISRKKVNKIFINIYSEAQSRLSTEGTCNLIEVTYDEFTLRHALKSASEKKFIEFVASVVANCEFKRCSMFLRLISYGSLAGTKSYSKYSVNLYLSSYQFLITSKIGIYVPCEEEDKMMIPTIRVVECVKEKFESIEKKAMMNEVLGKIEQKSIADPKKINGGGVIEMEAALEVMVDVYELYTMSIFRGFTLCLKAMGYENQVSVLGVDFNMILRLIGKPVRESFKELAFEDLMAYCIKNSVCQEEEILKFCLNDDQLDTREMFEAGVEKTKNLAQSVKDQEEKLKTHSADVWNERVLVLEGYNISEPELASLGVFLYMTEFERIHGEISSV